MSALRDSIIGLKEDHVASNARVLVSQGKVRHLTEVAPGRRGRPATQTVVMGPYDKLRDSGTASMVTCWSRKLHKLGTFAESIRTRRQLDHSRRS